jgi:hypothetical protein
MLESLPAEQQPIAQQLLRGGIPAVRTALHFERERAREAGRPEPSTEGVLALAESLVSRVKAAEWRDRAEAAIKAGDDLAMRDLRSLVSGSDVARDEASRELVVTLREMLERRIEAHRVTWADDVARSLDQGQVVRALRLSSRPPDAAARFSAELATRLRDAASAALSPATPEDQWLAVLQAVVESPVRRTVKPEGLPENPSPELLDSARQHCGRVPALAPLLGISVPPPPGPVRPNVPVKAPSRRPARPRRPSGHRTSPVGSEAPKRVEQGTPTDSESGGPAAGQVEADAAEPIATAEPVPAAEPVPFEPVIAEALAVEAVPVEAVPVEAVPVEAVPVEAVPVEAVTPGAAEDVAVAQEPKRDEPAAVEAERDERAVDEAVPAEVVAHGTAPDEPLPAEAVPDEAGREDALRDEMGQGEMGQAEMGQGEMGQGENGPDEAVAERVPDEPVPDDAAPGPSFTSAAGASLAGEP